jgi:hypothetical protein
MLFTGLYYNGLWINHRFMNIRKIRCLNPLSALYALTSPITERFLNIKAKGRPADI